MPPPSTLHQTREPEVPRSDALVDVLAVPGAPATSASSIVEAKPARPAPALHAGLLATDDDHARVRPLRVSLCLLTWNEVEGCRLDVPGLPLSAFDEVYALDNTSTDGTVQLLHERGIRVHRQQRRGYNAAIIEAFEHCTTDALVLFHPKGSIDPREVLRCREALERGADLAIASRLMKGGRNEEDAKVLRPRKWFVRGLGVLGAMVWKRSGQQAMVADVLHGFRGMRRDKFFAIEPLREGLSIDLEMVVRSYRKGFRVVEFPSIERPRAQGTTHFAAWPTGKKLLKYVWLELRRKA